MNFNKNCTTHVMYTPWGRSQGTTFVLNTKLTSHRTVQSLATYPAPCSCPRCLRSRRIKLKRNSAANVRSDPGRAVRHVPLDLKLLRRRRLAQQTCVQSGERRKRVGTRHRIVAPSVWQGRRVVDWKKLWVWARRLAG